MMFSIQQQASLIQMHMEYKGIYPFFTCSKDSYRINTCAFDCEALLLAGNNAAGVYDVKYYKGKFNAYQRTYILTLKNNNYSYFLFKYLLELKLNRMKEMSKGSNTRFLTMEILGTFSFTVPPVAEQKRIVAYLENRFSSVTKINTHLAEQAEAINALPAVILRKAFAGKM